LLTPAFETLVPYDKVKKLSRRNMRNRKQRQTGRHIDTQKKYLLMFECQGAMNLNYLKVD